MTAEQLGTSLAHVSGPTSDETPMYAPSTRAPASLVWSQSMVKGVPAGVLTWTLPLGPTEGPLAFAVHHTMRDHLNEVGSERYPRFGMMTALDPRIEGGMHWRLSFAARLKESQPAEVEAMLRAAFDSARGQEAVRAHAEASLKQLEKKQGGDRWHQWAVQAAQAGATQPELMALDPDPFASITAEHVLEAIHTHVPASTGEQN